MLDSIFLFITVIAVGLATTASAQGIGGLVDRAKEAVEDAAEDAEAAASSAAGAANTVSGDREKAIGDARALIEAYEQHYSRYRDLPEYDRVMHDWPDRGEEWLELLGGLPQAHEVEEFMAAPIDNHPGETIYEVNSYFINELGVRDSDVGGSASMTTAYSQLEQQLERVAQFKRDAAAGAVSMARQTMQALDERFLMAEIRVEKARALKSEFQLARRFDPNNEELNEMLASIDVYIDEVAEGVMAEIDAGRWPEAYGQTQHTQAVLSFFRGHPEWGGKEGVEVLAAAAQGDWVITEKDLLGRPIQWGLPVAVAATKPEWRELDAARVFTLTALARQGSPAPQAPPFTGYWVGESYLMRLDKVPR